MKKNLPILSKKSIYSKSIIVATELGTRFQRRYLNQSAEAFKLEVSIEHSHELISNNSSNWQSRIWPTKILNFLLGFGWNHFNWLNHRPEFDFNKSSAARWIFFHFIRIIIFQPASYSNRSYNGNMRRLL